MSISYDKLISKINYSPKDYQRDGVSWMVSIERNPKHTTILSRSLNNRFDSSSQTTDTETRKQKREPKYIYSDNHVEIRGGILGDEMGLGKTIQILSLILSNPKPSSLIVVPTTLISQWYTTIKTILNHKAYIYHGDTKDRTRLFNSPIVLTSYGMLKNINKNQSASNISSFSRIIYDEGHRLKNIKNQNYQNALEIRTDFTWIVTGTPVQNNESETLPYINLIFQCSNIRPKKGEGLKIIKSITLRRTRKQVGVRLPQLRNHNIKVYYKTEEEKNKMLMFKKEINQYYNDPKLRLARLMKNQQLLSCSSKSSNNRIMNIKINKIMDLVEKKLSSNVRENKGAINRILIFYTFNEERDVILEELRKKKSFSLFSSSRIPNTTTCKVICGGMKTKEKKEIINSTLKEETTPTILLINMSSSCEGLNLQRYNNVIITTVHWNPSVEKQAMTRAYRIGQERDVDVYRFIMCEEKSQTPESTTKDISNDREITSKISTMDTIEMYKLYKQEKKNDMVRLLF